MRTAIIGAAGQLGRAFTALLAGDAIALTRAEADLTRPAELRERLESLRPDRVINCSAYNLVDRAESEPEAAFAVNAWGVRDLASICRTMGVPLVHFSTDYVFGLDRDRSQPWAETDAPGPASAYGLSKLTGEFWVRQASERNLVIRTCGLYGRRGIGGKGGNFVETMLRVAGEGKPLRVVADQRCTPSFVGDIARATLELIQNQAAGLVHLTNTGDCSWHEFAAEIFRQAGLQPQLSAITSAEYPTAAQRPKFSVLALDRARALGAKSLRPWRDGLADYLAQREK